MRQVVRKTRWLVGMLWILSWFELYLEIYRHHHVTPSLLLNPSLWRTAATTGQSLPGGWLLTVLACSALAPLLFALLLLVSRLPHTRVGAAWPARGEPSFPIAFATTAIGCMLFGLASVNQLIRRPPMKLDLTLQTGNGGFLVLGAALVVVGWMLSRFRSGREAAEPSPPHHTL